MNKNSQVYNHDIVIVGGGPSSMGLIYGLLSPYDCQSNLKDPNSKQQKEQNQSQFTNVLPKFTIALIERGGEEISTSSTKDSQMKNGTHLSNVSRYNSKNWHYRNVIRDPQRWFQASHYCEPYCSKVYDSVPQKALHNRIMPIVTGMGLGGGSNINACLVVRPSPDDFDMWPSKWGGRTTSTDDNNTDNDIKTNSRMMEAVLKVEDIMKQNKALTVQPSLRLKSDFNDDGASLLMKKEEDERYEKNSDNVFTKMKVDSSEMLLSSSIEEFIMPNVTCASQRISHNAVDAEGSNKNLRRRSCYQSSYHRRVNYYEALLEPLLRRNPQFKNIITFYSGVQVERILIEKNSRVERLGRREKGREWKAVGVECLFAKSDSSRGEDEYFKVMAKSRVILCAGAILSPVLLLVSGIGNSTELKEIGITPLENNVNGTTTITKNHNSQKNMWDAVGKQLKDHFLIPFAFLSLPGFWERLNSCNGIRGWMALDIPINCDEEKDEADSTSTISSESPQQHPSIARCTITFSDATSLPWIAPHNIISPWYREYTFIQSAGLSHFIQSWFNFIVKKLLLLLRALLLLAFQWIPRYVMQCFVVGLMIQVLNPESTGSVVLRKKINRKDNNLQTSKTNAKSFSRISDFDIIVDPGYLTNERDMKRVLSCCKVLNAVSANCFSRKCIEIVPGPLYRYLKSIKDVKCFTRDFAIPYYHWSGTCAMEKKKTMSSLNEKEGSASLSSLFVVQDDLQVNGIENLYVCDASVFPTNISGPTALTCAGLGYATSTFVWKDLIAKIN